MDNLPIQLGQMVSSDELGFSLHNAAKSGNKKELKKVLDRGINVDYSNDQGQSPLFCACYENKEGAVRFLLSKSANPNERSNDGITPVHVVCYTGNGNILSELLNFGGDLRLHDSQNRGAKDWALLNPDPKKMKKVLEFLDKARLFAMSQSGTDFLSDGEKPELLLARDKSLSVLARNNSVVQMFKARLGNSIHVGLDMVKSVQSVAFGKVYKNNEENEERSGIISTVPLVNENQLHHDVKGKTFDSCLMMVMESMLWHHTEVTVKRTHGHDHVAGVVDLLINDMEYMGKIRHPNVLLLMGVCHTDNLDGLVVIYERVHLGSLFNFMHFKQERLPVDNIKEILLQICDAMAFIHHQHLIHCSFSSHAVNMINPSFVKIGNFEYMTERGKKCPNSMKTFKHALYNWMAPEIMMKSCVIKATDIYSFCVVIWEIFQGQIPWGDIDAEATKIKLLKDKSQLPIDSAKIPAMYQTLLRYGLQLNPEDRRVSFSNIKHIIILPEQDVEDYIKNNCSVESSHRFKASSFNTNSSADGTVYSSSEQSSNGRTNKVKQSWAAHQASAQCNTNNNFDNFEEFVKKDSDAWSSSTGTWDAPKDLSEDDTDSLSLSSITHLKRFPNIGVAYDDSKNNYSPTTEPLPDKKSLARMYPRISHLRAGLSNNDLKLESKPSSWSYLELQEWASSTGGKCVKPASHQDHLANDNIGKLTTAGSLYAIYNRMASPPEKGQFSSTCSSPRRNGINETPIIKQAEHQYLEDNPEVIEASKDWYGGQGSVQNLISQFQNQVENHKDHQDVLEGKLTGAVLVQNSSKKRPVESKVHQKSKNLVEQWLQHRRGKQIDADPEQLKKENMSDDGYTYSARRSENCETESLGSLTTTSMAETESNAGIGKQASTSSQSEIISGWINSEIHKVTSSLSRDIFQELRERHATEDNSPLLFNEDSLDQSVTAKGKFQDDGSNNVQRKSKKISSPDRTYEPVEYYFDDEIHPDMQNESHMKLQMEPNSYVNKQKQTSQRRKMEKLKSPPQSRKPQPKKTIQPNVPKHVHYQQPFVKEKKLTMSHRITEQEEIEEQQTDLQRFQFKQRKLKKKMRSMKAAYRSTVRVRSSLVNPGEHIFTHTMTDLHTGQKSTVQKQRIQAVQPGWLFDEDS